jgi:hypothetical protein
MNVSPQLASVLVSAGHECTHSSVARDPRSTDETIPRFAKANDFILLTHDLYFGAILAITLSPEPRDESRVTGEPRAVASRSIVLERFLADRDADHARAFRRTVRLRPQSPVGKDHEPLIASRHHDTRILRQLGLDQRSKLRAKILRRNRQPAVAP